MPEFRSRCSSISEGHTMLKLKHVCMSSHLKTRKDREDAETSGWSNTTKMNTLSLDFLEFRSSGCRTSEKKIHCDIAILEGVIPAMPIALFLYIAIYARGDERFHSPFCSYTLLINEHRSPTFWREAGPDRYQRAPTPAHKGLVKKATRVQSSIWLSSSFGPPKLPTLRSLSCDTIWARISCTSFGTVFS